MHCLTRVQCALSESALLGPYQPNDTTPPHPPHHHLTCQGQSDSSVSVMESSLFVIEEKKKESWEAAI